MPKALLQDHVLASPIRPQEIQFHTTRLAESFLLSLRALPFLRHAACLQSSAMQGHVAKAFVRRW
jgi:hypothetical protein